ncbi:hypothetical protein [Halomarina oriensis]|uniref:DUF1059 domain-containing protein n=1 Tax=Halomarina oriensis TaxID=671145 RepID=A0A6B0GJR1_9EURY|nr:hypothetical protein [Halomarina oriensis]MWG33639.1 hypothetical protein [Halomarina oriensis]
MGEEWWRLVCTQCEFRGRAAERELAERLAAVHADAADHDVDIVAPDE